MNQLIEKGARRYLEANYEAIRRKQAEASSAIREEYTAKFKDGNFLTRPLMLWHMRRELWRVANLDTNLYAVNPSG